MKQLYKNVFIDSSLVFEMLAALFRVQNHEKLLPVDPRNNEHIPKELTTWVMETRKKMSNDMKKNLETFFNYESYLGLILVPGCWAYREHTDIDSFFKFLEKTPAKDLIRGFFCTGFGEFHNIYSHIQTLSEPTEIMEFVKRKNLPQDEKWKLFYMFFDADNAKQQFIDLIKSFYESFFKEKIPFLSKHHQESIGHFSKLIEEDTEKNLNRFLNINLSDYKEMQYIMLFPSYYYNTCGLNSDYTEISSFVYLYGTQQPHIRFKQTIDEGNLIESIKALSDENRMKIIRILNTAPSYGYELGQKLGLSNSTVSHHLSLLVNSGFITASRNENKVYYEVNKDHIKKVLGNVGEFLT